MYRRALVVVPENGRYVCATVQEDGQMRVRMSDDWERELAEDSKDLAFRVFVPPVALELEEDRSYYVLSPDWTPFDQNYWVQYFQMALRKGKDIPSPLVEDLNFLTKCLKARNSSDWASVDISSNPRFSKLYAVLLGFKVLADLRKNRLANMEMVVQEREGAEGSNVPGPSVPDTF